MRPRPLLFALITVLAMSLAVPATAAPPEGSGPTPAAGRRVLLAYAEDTWGSFEAMVDPHSGLPSDKVSADGTRAVPTSPTNIGAYLWSTLVARDTGVIKPREARERVAHTLTTLADLERHEQSGQFYNWYDHRTGEKLRTWPESGDTVYPFLSSVDNGWLAAALWMVSRAVPQSADEAGAILEDMDFGFYYDAGVGQLRGGFWDEPAPGCTFPDNYRGGADVYYTCHHYGSLNTEPRIASYLGIAMGDIPPEHYFRMWRTFPDTCDWSWQEMRPQGEWHTYLGVDVFEGHYTYRDLRIVPSWGGSMFEALMVPLLVPEAEWGPDSWGVNHPLYVRAQIEHGLDEAGYGYWGFSPANDPAGGYREYGVDPIGLNPDGYTSDVERTTVNYGFGDCPGREPQPPPDAYGQGVVTPHAAFLALEFAPDEALDNLANLRADFDVYGDWGFYDSVNVATGQVSEQYLALDQGMIMAALGNELRGGRLQRYLVRGEFERAIRPLLAQEDFTAGDDS